MAGTKSKSSSKAGSPLLGKYELGRLLGRGTFAKVYHARCLAGGDPVAVKVLDKPELSATGMAVRVLREVSAMRRLRHPNVLRLHEVLATRSKVYLVMELAPGGDLLSRLASLPTRRLPEQAARRVFLQLVSALIYSHARGVFHRDVKPQNVLIDADGNLKVSDFGLAALPDSLRDDGHLHTACGTPAFTAPEVLRRKAYDGAKADVWSCGVILFVLMAGYLPFHDKNLMAMYKKIYKGEFRCARWFSKDLTSLLMRILDTNPNTRITLPEIMESRWFKKGFKPVKFYIEDDKLHSVIDDEDGLLDMGPADPVPHSLPSPPRPLPPQKVDGDDSGSESDSSISSCPASVLSDESQRSRGSLPRPASLNAFDIISFSRGFNLSGLFEEKGDEVRFVSAEPMSDILMKLEEIAKLKSFKLRRKDWRICLEGTREGVKGPLTIGAEIFELTPPLVMVEVKKKAGDNEEYEDFCNKELKPGMQHLVHHMVRTPSMPTDAK